MNIPTADSPRWTHVQIAGAGVQLHCVEASWGVARGEGPLMVFLHGFPEFWYSWRHQLCAFAEDYYVVAPDMRGYNLSEKPAGTEAYRLEVLVEDIRALIEGLGYERCVLVGHDWGGAVAWEFAYTYPEMLERLVVMNMPHLVRFYEGTRTLSQLRRSWYIFAFQVPWLPEKLLSLRDYQAIPSLFAAQIKNPDALDAEALEAFRRAAAQPGALSGMLNYYRAARNKAVSFDRERYGVLGVPTLMIWGEDDTALGKELTHDTDRLVRDFQIVYIPDCSHWVQQDRPAQVTASMRAFLTGSEG